jgi:hemolysin activation/secretion protein
MFLRFLAFCLAFGALRLPLLADSAAQEIYPLAKLLIADTDEKVTALPGDSGGHAPVFVQDVALFAGPDFHAVIKPFIGQPITIDLVNRLGVAITDYAKVHDRLIAKVTLPATQQIATGVLRLIVVVGRYNELSFRGNRWFSRELLEQRLGIKPGDEVRLSTLEEAVNWVNTNPFRQVKVLINDLPHNPGKADLVIGVEDRRPIRLAFAFSDSGNEIIGENQYTASIQFGNLWRRDHQGSYHFVTSDDVRVYQAHAFDYRVPLHWRHFIQISGNYILTNPVFAGGLFQQKGKTLVADVRYAIPLQGGNNPRELYFGVDFKQSNNTLDWDPYINPVRVLDTTTDTFQAFAGFSAIRRDERGAWMFGANLRASPGNLNSRNSDANLQNARSGASSTYVYGTLALQRLQKLGESGWEVFGRGVMQAASNNLLASEQLAIGGLGTVRGFDPNLYAAEQGFVFGVDLMTPAWKQKLPFKKVTSPVETRFALFYDAAQVEYKKRYPSDISFAPLASAGVGIRTSFRNNFSLSFDYGWQLTHLPRPPLDRSRGHLKAVLAF